MVFGILRVAVLVSLILPGAGAIQAKTFLAVFAHPDDEIMAGPLLAKYAAEGHRVFLVTITSGQIGASNTDIPAGKQLGAAREEEGRCSCRNLGIEPPIFLRFQDGGTADRSVLRPIEERLREIIEQKKPDAVLTWGPDGMSGHPDHRMASNLVTEVLQERSELHHVPSRLYYLAVPTSVYRRAIQHPVLAERARSFNHVDDSLLTEAIDCADYLAPVLKAIECHVTQWGKRMEQVKQLRTEILGGTIYLRLALNLGSQLKN